MDGKLFPVTLLVLVSKKLMGCEIPAVLFFLCEKKEKFLRILNSSVAMATS
jgi:hypothetical protein